MDAEFIFLCKVNSYIEAEIWPHKNKVLHHLKHKYIHLGSSEVVFYRLWVLIVGFFCLPGEGDGTLIHVQECSQLQHCSVYTVSCKGVDRQVSNLNAEVTKHVSSA